MASSGWVVGVFSGRPQFDVILNVWRHSTSGNSTRWSWRLTARQFTSYDSWHLDPVGGSVNVAGDTFGVSHNLDFRGSTTEIVLGSGTTGWKAHNSAGYLTVNFSFSFGPAGLFGSASGSNSFSADRIPKAPSAPPAPVYQSRTANSLTFTITQPSDNGGSAILDYRMNVVPVAGGAGEQWTSGSSSQTSPATLLPNTEYNVQYRARNAVGLGPWSAIVKMTTAVGLPSAPRNPALRDPSPTGVTLDWDAPTADGGSAVTSYKVARARNSAFNIDNVEYTQVASAGTERALTGLLPSTEYFFRVAAINSAGQGPWSDPVSMTTVSGAYISTGSAWQACGVYVSSGGNWVPCEVFVSNGTTWRPAN